MVMKAVNYFNFLYYTKNSPIEATILCKDLNAKDSGSINFYKTEAGTPASSYANNLVTLNYPISRFNDISKILLLGTDKAMALSFNPETLVGELITDTSWWFDPLP